MSVRVLRCAVYTRKSSEEGLDQAFNSLDAQRQAGLDYIRSQKSLGWTPVSSAYDDGGYSGGSTDRPGLQRLLADIRSRKVDVVLVYKVDRLSRSLADFARLMQVFDELNVSFVSVTQQFNTTTSMGRLTLNMLLSFAQFEREVTGERIRDKIAATKRTGVWVGGRPPLGYRLPNATDPGFTPGDRTLKIVEPQARLVRAIYQGYLESGSLVDLAWLLTAQKHTTKRWTSAKGSEHGGRPLTAAFLYRVLNNPIYVGKITHTRAGQTEVYPGKHASIIGESLWNKVHERMRTAERALAARWTHTHLLKGKLRTMDGHAMSPGSVLRPPRKGSDAATGPRRVPYYISQKALKHGYASCPVKNINATHLDDLVRGLVLEHLRQHHDADLRGLDAAVRDMHLREVIHSVSLAPTRLVVELDTDALSHVPREDLHPSSPTDGDVPACPYAPSIEQSDNGVVLTLAARLQRLDGRRVLVAPDGSDLLVRTRADGAPVPQVHLVRAVGQAFAWHRELLSTRVTITALALREQTARGRVQQLLPLAGLGPRALHAVLTGRLSQRITLRDLLQAAKRPCWQEQIRLLGLAEAP